MSCIIINEMKKDKRGEVRIISGKWKGKKIFFNLNQDLRPTPDRAKETLFNWLGQDMRSLNCLDLFSGTGALGLEAISRNAQRVTFVEKNKSYLQAIEKVIFSMDKKKDCDFICEDCLSWIKKYKSSFKYDLVFIDPPFNKNLIQELIENILDKRILRDKGKLYFEYEKGYDLELPKEINLIKEKSLGGKSYTLGIITYLSS